MNDKNKRYEKVIDSNDGGDSLACLICSKGCN